MKHNFFDMGKGVHVIFLTPREARDLVQICEVFQSKFDDYSESDARLAQEIEFELGRFT